MDRIGSPEIGPQIYEYLTFDNGAKFIKWNKESLFSEKY